MAEDALDARMLQKQVHHAGVATNGENVDIAAGIASTADAANRNEFNRRALARAGSSTSAADTVAVSASR